MKTLKTTELLPLAIDRKDRTTKRYFDHETAIMHDIAANGIRTPVKVYADGKQYRIACGQTRVNAAIRAGLADIPVQVLEGEMTATRLIVEELTDNNMGEPFDLMALAGMFLELMKTNGWSQTELCAAVPAAKPSTVSRALAVFEGLVPELKEKLKAGEFGPRMAYALSRVPADRQAEAWNKCQHMKVERAELFISSALGKAQKKKAKPVKVTVAGLSVVFTVSEAAKAKELLQCVMTALVKLEKNGFPLPNLPALVKAVN